MSNYYQENKDRILQNCREYNAINYDKIRKYQRDYYRRKKEQQKNQKRGDKHKRLANN